MAPVGSSAPAIPCESLGVTASFQLTTTETGWIYKRHRGHVAPPWGGAPRLAAGSVPAESPYLRDLAPQEQPASGRLRRIGALAR